MQYTRRHGPPSLSWHFSFCLVKKVVRHFCRNAIRVELIVLADLTSAFLIYEDMMEFLLTNKADINAKTTVGFTPLHRSVDFGANDERKAVGIKDVVELLLAMGARINARDQKGETPLFLAAKNGSKGVVALLCQHGGHE
jgi:hypothetical protein